jgi:hypothetical protein
MCGRKKFTTKAKKAHEDRGLEALFYSFVFLASRSSPWCAFAVKNLDPGQCAYMVIFYRAVFACGQKCIAAGPSGGGVKDQRRGSGNSGLKKTTSLVGHFFWAHPRRSAPGTGLSAPTKTLRVFVPLLSLARLPVYNVSPLSGFLRGRKNPGAARKRPHLSRN